LSAARAAVVRLGDVGSTNDEAMARLRGGEGPLWVTAERQISGRGRRGRPWVSEAGNLYASFAFEADWPHERIGILPLAAAVALGDALACLGLSAALKWPNDVLLDGRKCAGILLETEGGAVPGRSAARRIVIGFGVNVAHHPHDAPSAVHIAAVRPGTCAPEVLDALRPALASALSRLSREDGPRQVRDLWLSRAVGVGGPVIVRYDEEVIEGRFLGLDPAGRLILGEPGGATRLVAAGDVFVKAHPRRADPLKRSPHE